MCTTFNMNNKHGKPRISSKVTKQNQIVLSCFGLGWIKMHLHDQGLVLRHNVLKKAQHVDPTHLHISLQLLASSSKCLCKLYKFKILLQAMNKEGIQGL